MDYLLDITKGLVLNQFHVIYLISMKQLRQIKSRFVI